MLFFAKHLFRFRQRFRAVVEQIVDFPVVHFDHPEHQLPAQSECQRRFWVNDRLHRLDDVLFRDGVFIQFAVHVRGEPDGPERASFGENELRIEHIVVVDCRHTTTTRSVLDSEFKFKPPLFSRKCVSSSSSLKINTTRALLLGGKKRTSLSRKSRVDARPFVY